MATDIALTDPMLDALQDAGGYSSVLLPLPGSPLINAGDPGALPCPSRDQLGEARLASGTIDIGAVEFDPSLAAPVILSASKNGALFEVTVMTSAGSLWRIETSQTLVQPFTDSGNTFTGTGAAQVVSIPLPGAATTPFFVRFVSP